MKELGLYYPDGQFRSDKEVKRKLALEGRLPEMKHVTPIKLPLDVNHYLDRATERSEQMQELSPRSENLVKITLPRTSIISVLADLHHGHMQTHHQRIKQELEVIRNTPDSYVILGADLVEGIHWGGASGGEQSANLDEQHAFLRSLFKALQGKIIVGVSGEHDSKWASRVSGDPYGTFGENALAPYVRGIAEVEVAIKQQNYRLIIQHRARGFSMYNKNHPTYRQVRFELQGGDVYCSSHTHKKQISQEAIREFDNARIVTHISTGAYRSGDEYGDRQGFVHQKPKEMYGASFVLNADRKQVDVDYDIISAHRKFRS